MWILLGILLGVLSAPIVLEDEEIFVAFDPSNYSLIYLAENSQSRNLLSPSQTPSWTLQIVRAGSSDLSVIDSSQQATRSHEAKKDRVVFKWASVGGTAMNVQLHVSLHESKLHYRLSFDSADTNVGVWTYQLSLGAQTLSTTHEVLQNYGFGNRQLCSKGACKSFSGSYPQMTYQFLTAYDPIRGVHPAIYFGAHDPSGEAKQFGMDIRPPAPTGGTGSAVYWLRSQPPNAGMSKTNHTMTYPIVVSVYKGDWWDAAQIYRDWALTGARWTSKGPLSHRKDVPHWLWDITTWVNSHWQENDIFNLTGGDPTVVASRVSAIKRRFNISGGLGLHWYEWDTLGYRYGSNYSDCTSEVTCGFDTHYPEYFPPREGFEKALEILQSQGIRVAPYINGRIYDQATKKWKDDNAIRWMAKKTTTQLNSHDLLIYEEQYGSKAVFAVSCPHTQYWQEVIAQTVDEIVHKYSCDGVYIDQIAAAGPKNCWDHNHGHTLGGGDYWVSGYRAMLDRVRAKAGNNAMILTESNAEPFMDGINVFLTLVGFQGDFNGPTSIAPVFASIYGGYYFSMGAMFFASDFTSPDVFAAKIAKQYVFGAQLGWFSLGGRDNQDPFMGIYSQLMDSKYDPEVHYLRTLSHAKTNGNVFLQQGQAMRELSIGTGEDSLITVPNMLRAGCAYLDCNSSSSMSSFTFSSVSSAVWRYKDTLFITLTRVTRTTSDPRISFVLNTDRYNYHNSHDKTFVLTQIFPQKRIIGEYPGCCINYNGPLNPRTVLSFTVALKDE